MDEDPILRVEVTAPTAGELREFTDAIGPDLGCRPIARHVEGGVAIDVYVPASTLEASRGSRAAEHVNLRVVANQSEEGRQRQAEVAEGDRFAARSAVPRGLGRKE
jgi:hypothetical protein